MSETAALQDRFNFLKKLVLNNDATSLQSALEDSDQTSVLNYCSGGQVPLLILAAEKNFVDVAKLLLRAKAAVNLEARRKISLCVAAELGHDEMVSLLLEQPEVAIDKEDESHRTALMYAADKGRINIVRRLLDAKASVGSSLVSAAGGGHCHLLELLLQHKADLHARDRNDNGCLHAAARQGRRDAVSFLLKANATVDMLGRNGSTPLMDACYSGHLSVVRFLLTADANVNQRDNDRRTALHVACRSQTIVDELLKAGADPNAVDSEGCSALNLAAHWSEQVGTMMSLLNAKADIDLADNSGDTPLIWAIQHAPALSVKLLLQNGADWLKKGRKSARQAMRQYRTDEIVALFECLLCGWEGMCCLKCRKKYCVLECDKFSDISNKRLSSTVDCRIHQKLAYQSVLEWTLAMSSLNLPSYVLEIIFNSLKLNSKHEDYQQRKGSDFISIASTEKSSKINENFIHLIIEERTHLQNIRLFISVQKAYRKSQENKQ